MHDLGQESEAKTKTNSRIENCQLCLTFLALLDENMNIPNPSDSWPHDINLRQVVLCCSHNHLLRPFRPVDVVPKHRHCVGMVHFTAYAELRQSSFGKQKLYNITLSADFESMRFNR